MASSLALRLARARIDRAIGDQLLAYPPPPDAPAWRHELFAELRAAYEALVASVLITLAEKIDAERGH